MVQAPKPAGERYEIDRVPIVLAGHTLIHESHPDHNDDDYFTDPSTYTIGVFDGVGGRPGSDEASRLSAGITRDYMQLVPDRMEPVAAEAALKAAVELAHATVQYSGHGRIGTTAALARVFEGPDSAPFLAVATVADSRIYLLRDGELQFLSFDKGRNVREASMHTLGTQRRLADLATRDQLADFSFSGQADFRHRNLIYGMLGQEGDCPLVTTHSLPLQAGDVILATSDGIHDNLTHAEIQEVLAGATGPEGATADLTRLAQQRSRDTAHIRAKPDDMTAVALYYDR